MIKAIKISMIEKIEIEKIEIEKVKATPRNKKHILIESAISYLQDMEKRQAISYLWGLFLM